jgi:hypothetical protein
MLTTACDQDGVDSMWTEEGMCTAETLISRSTLAYIFRALLALSRPQCHTLQRAYIPLPRSRTIVALAVFCLVCKLVINVNRNGQVASFPGSVSFFVPRVTQVEGAFLYLSKRYSIKTS